MNISNSEAQHSPATAAEALPGAGGAVDARDLVKTYGETRALDGLSFSVEEGIVFGLLGPNGAGKSTTVKILTSLSRPDSGSATVAGIDVLADPNRLRHAIGVVNQHSSVDEEATGRENLQLQGRLYGIRGEELERRVDELLEGFSLADAGNRISKGYSGGMKRRLDVAMGLIHRPRVLFLDEPTTGLDPEVRVAMWEELRRLNAEGLTILLTTHYLDEADALAERLAFVDAGKVVVEGRPAELKAELGGETIEVELTAPPADGSVGAALERIETIRDLGVHDRRVQATVDDGAAALPAVLGALAGAGVEVGSATMSRPSLDDVYLTYTGRSFEEADRTHEGESEES
jgi:ABC-2 type transport system ATP-binding protein